MILNDANYSSTVFDWTLTGNRVTALYDWVGVKITMDFEVTSISTSSMSINGTYSQNSSNYNEEGPINGTLSKVQ